jgi:pyridoxine 4-dehydrogenase
MPPSTLQTKGTAAWSRLGLGTGTLASLGRAIPRNEAVRLISTMIEERVNVIDTADTYASGDCEILLGKLMKGCRDSFHIVTKAGYRYADLRGPFRALNQPLKKLIHSSAANQNFEAKYLEGCLHASLRRLRTDRVEAFLLHNPPLEIISREEIPALFEKLEAAGKIRLGGVSSNKPEVLAAAAVTGRFGVIQTPSCLNAAGTFSQLWRTCEEKGIHVIGNHVFDPSCLALDGIDHESLMRGAATLLPHGATILCGTKNSWHLRQSNQWIRNPMSKPDAQNLSSRCQRVFHND